ncbi:hypothetical protein SBOR_9790 [Sclerotinia borealis F-4128]|uniref:Uncharacterized protein n=1 Tax=Sclerotinia borealis (strain F-4128) TaxID=1432307 RepID=W9C1S8_SCLBF|nr:hypothetical protein SBOR_9790 [Sclerotinia borealis F-4128]
MRLSPSLPLFVSFYLLLLSFIGALAADQAVSADDAWHIKGGSTDGGCDIKGRKAIINKWNDESRDLAAHAYTAILQYSSDIFIRKACLTFFGLTTIKSNPTAPQNAKTLAKITRELEKLKDLFESNSERPKAGLFCSSQWLKLVSGGTDAVAYDFTGKQIFIDGKPQTVGEVYDEFIKPGQVPFWSEDLKGYDFSPAKNDDFCSKNPDTKGYTEDLNGYSPDSDDDDDDYEPVGGREPSVPSQI